MEKNRSNIKDEINDLFELYPNYINNLAEKVTNLFTEKDISNYRRIYFVGSGDSYSASIAGVRIFETLASRFALKFIPITALDFARYLDFSDIETSTTLVVVTSISGEGSRVIEVIERSKLLEIDTLLITDNPAATLLEKSKFKLHLDIPEYKNVGPALRSYFVSTITLYLLAARFQDPKTTSKEIENMAKYIGEYLMSHESFMDRYEKEMLNLAEQFKDAKSITIIGDKNEESSCKFAVSKIIELTGIHSRWDDSEEWGHINYFNKFTGNENPIFFIGDTKSKNLSRLIETINQADKVKKPTILFIDQPFKSDEINKNCKVIELPKYSENYLQPLLSYIPLALFAHHLSGILNEKPWRGDILDEADNTIRNSEVVVYGEKPDA